MSLVLHRFGVDDDYDTWRAQFTGAIDLSDPVRNLDVIRVRQLAAKRLRRTSAGLSITERNPLSLFGSGAIDSIPDSVIEAAAGRNKDFPEVHGRVSSLEDGRIGRFGWKAQKAALSDFVLTACAVELGLNVPGEPQSTPPQRQGYKAPGYDLDESECEALIAYVRSLPSPLREKPETAPEAGFIREGRVQFGKLGCVACHRQRLGEVDGIYSDLLLHDMGRELQDTGRYGAFVADRVKATAGPAANSSADAVKNDRAKRRKEGGATAVEWRTPPLWGLRDSAPTSTTDERTPWRRRSISTPARHRRAPSDMQRCQ